MPPKKATSGSKRIRSPTPERKSLKQATLTPPPSTGIKFNSPIELLSDSSSASSVLEQSPSALVKTTNCITDDHFAIPPYCGGYTADDATTTLAVLFPHQLYAAHPCLLEPRCKGVLMCEDSLFFGDMRYPATFHKQKLWLHRATMKRYESQLRKQGYPTAYVEYRGGCGGGGDDGSNSKPLHQQPLTLLSQLQSGAKQLGIVKEDGKHIRLDVVDPVDFILERRLKAACEHLGWTLTLLPSPGFLNTKKDNDSYRSGKTRWFMADFYKVQRTRLGVLMTKEGDPQGGKWSFDADNQKKIPKTSLKSIPPLLQLKRDAFDEEAVQYVQRNFPANPGTLDRLFYPTSHQDAKVWLNHFVSKNLKQFGDYEDAIVEGESWLWHSVLTPTLNIGLLTPQDVLSAAIGVTTAKGQPPIPLNSLEGFIRQVIGWREFMRATYEDLGVKMRTTNHWNHTRKLPQCFYTGTTGILPVDDTIKRVLATGYCHHIERLMVLGGFLFLCEIDPDDIYSWFMEMFVDSYDWVMVTNVYAMSQNADGGLITTKPYFSGSAYVKKMSHYPAGDWCDTWDGLYWRWVWLHSDALQKNPRWAMMCSAAKKMDPTKRAKHVQAAEDFLAKIDSTSLSINVASK